MTEAAVSADRPDSPIHVTGTDHVTVTGSNPADTIAFYRDLLGMPLVLRQPNLDRPEVTHLFFDTGDGRMLTFFVTDEQESNARPRMDVGSVHHLAFSVPAERLEEVKAALEAADRQFSEFDRGAFHSVYTRDNNGLTIELVVDKFDIPDDHRGEVLALAHAIRVEVGADYVDDEHMREALEELGIEAEERVTSNAPAGTGMGEDG